MMKFFRRAKNRDDENRHDHTKEGEKLRVFCVTHEAPLVPDALADFVIGIGDYHPTPKRGAHISALDAYWDEMRPYAYGAAGNYVIPKAIDAAGHTDLTGIFSHRKIIVRTQIGRRSPGSDFYFDVEVEQAAHLPREEIEPRAGFDFLIGFPITFNQGVVGQYIEAHYGIDLFDYVSLAVEMGVLPLKEAQRCATEQLFIPGGCESGIYPTTWVRPVLEGLAKLGREFVTRRGARILRYGNFQIRAVGFLAERLGSYLLLSELRRRFSEDFPPELFGYLCVIVPPGGTYRSAKVS
jgi:hypothetical protein